MEEEDDEHEEGAGEEQVRVKCRGVMEIGLFNEASSSCCSLHLVINCPRLRRARVEVGIAYTVAIRWWIGGNAQEMGKKGERYSIKTPDKLIDLVTRLMTKSACVS